MALTPAEEKELAELEAQFAPQDELTPEEEAELVGLEEELQPSTLEAAGRGVAQGFTFGFADELVGWLESATKRGTGFDKTYEQSRDESREAFRESAEAHPKTTLAADVVGSLLVPIPGVGVIGGGAKAVVTTAKGASKIAKAVKTGAGYGGISALGRSEGKDVEEITKDTLVGIGLGAGLGVGLGAAGAGFSKYTSRVKEKIAEHQADIFKGAQKILDDRPPPGVNDWFENAAQKEVDDLASHIKGKAVTGDDADEIIVKAIDDASIDKHYEMFNYRTAAAKYVDEVGVKGNPELMPFVRKAFNFISDAQNVYQSIDDKWGTTLTPTLNKLAGQKYNLYTTEMATVKLSTDKIKTLFKSATVKTDDVFDHINYGKPINLVNDADKAVVQRTRQMFEEMRERAEDLGLPVQELIQEGQTGGYITNALVDKLQFRQRIQGKLDQVLGKYDEAKLMGANSPDKLQKLIEHNKDMSDLVAGLGVITDTPINKGGDIFKAINSMYLPRSVSSTNLTSKANAMLQRKDKIPDFLLEKDITKLVNRWASNTYRHAMFRDELAEMTTNMHILQDLDPVAADYIGRHIQSILGKPSKFGTLTNDVQTKAMNMAGKAKTDTGRKAWETVAKLPDVAGYLQSQIYANYLGANPRAVLRNLTQTAVMTMPEMGLAGHKATTRAMKYMMKGYGEIAKGIKNAPLGNDAFRKSAMGRELAEGGWLPHKFVGEGDDLMRQALKENAGFAIKGGSKAKEMLDKASDMAMTWYEKSDLLNRAATLRMSKSLAKDFLDGDEIARSIFNQMPRGYKIKIEQALTKRDGKEVTRLMADHFLSSTQFNYNKIALSEFAREFGPVFSMFTKWPTSVAGDMIAKARRDGVVKGGGKSVFKYGAPWAMLATADAMFDDLTPRQEEMMGKRGLSSWAPVGAAKSVVTGEVFMPPALQAATSFSTAVSSPKADSMQKYIERTAQSFAPGGWLTRLWFDDIPHYMNKETK